jgi:hypothetical protein
VSLAHATGPTPVTTLPADFKPAAVVRCEVVRKTVAGQGERDFAVGQTATSGLDAFVTALRIPSSTTNPTGQGCSPTGIVLPNFALVDARGHIVRPRLPVDDCDFPLPQALDALSALPWRTVTEQKLSQVRSQDTTAAWPAANAACLAARSVPSPRPWHGRPPPAAWCSRLRLA